MTSEMAGKCVSPCGGSRVGRDEGRNRHCRVRGGPPSIAHHGPLWRIVKPLRFMGDLPRRKPNNFLVSANRLTVNSLLSVARLAGRLDSHNC